MRLVSFIGLILTAWLLVGKVTAADLREIIRNEIKFDLEVYLPWLRNRLDRFEKQINSVHMFGLTLLDHDKKEAKVAADLIRGDIDLIVSPLTDISDGRSLKKHDAIRQEKMLPAAEKVGKLQEKYEAALNQAQRREYPAKYKELKAMVAKGQHQEAATVNLKTFESEMKRLGIAIPGY